MVVRFRVRKLTKTTYLTYIQPGTEQFNYMSSTNMTVMRGTTKQTCSDSQLCFVRIVHDMWSKHYFRNAEYLYSLYRTQVSDVVSKQVCERCTHLMGWNLGQQPRVQQQQEQRTERQECSRIPQRRRPWRRIAAPSAFLAAA